MQVTEENKDIIRVMLVLDKIIEPLDKVVASERGGPYLEGVRDGLVSFRQILRDLFEV